MFALSNLDVYSARSLAQAVGFGLSQENSAQAVTASERCDRDVLDNVTIVVPCAANRSFGSCRHRLLPRRSAYTRASSFQQPMSIAVLSVVDGAQSPVRDGCGSKFSAVSLSGLILGRERRIREVSA